MIMKSIAYALLILCFAFCNCAYANLDGSTQSSTQQTAQRIFCERSYTNFAWGFQHRGIYVDSEGDVFRYEYQRDDRVWSPKQPDSPTEQELEDKYNHGRKAIGKVGPQELHEKYRLVEPASRGRLSKHVQRGADQGESVSRCYLLDAAAGRYKEVELKVAGDWSYENPAPSAKELTKWLESLEASKEEQKPAAKNTPDEQDYAVYSALINQNIRSDRVELIVIEDHTEIGGGLLPKNYSGFSKYVSEETFADFIANQERDSKLDRQFTLKADYVLLSQSEIEAFSRDWQRFYEKYPGSSHGVISLSNIGYDKTRHEAMVVTSYYCGPRCCGSSYVFLAREQDGWRIKKAVPAAIC